jgi:hypothetical protein
MLLSLGEITNTPVADDDGDLAMEMVRTEPLRACLTGAQEYRLVAALMRTLHGLVGFHCRCSFFRSRDDRLDMATRTYRSW